MIENISNIGQMLMPTIAVNQAVSGKGQLHDSKRFSINEDGCLPEKRTDEAAKADNVSEKAVINYKNTIQRNQKADDKKLNGYTHKKTQGSSDGKNEFKETRKAADNQDNVVQANNEENDTPEVVS